VRSSQRNIAEGVRIWRVVSDQVRSGFAFGRFLYDAAQVRLLLAGREVPLTAREMHLLVIFLARPGEWLEEEWLARGLWPNAVAPTGELDRLVRALTAALDEGADGVATIQTLKRRGYRLLIPVRPLEALEPASAPPSASGAASGTRPAPGSSERGYELAGGRGARRSRVLPAQIAAGLLVAGAGVLAMLWWMGPPDRAGGAGDGSALAVPNPAAMRAAAAAELAKGLAAAPLPDLASRRAAISHFEAALQLDSSARHQAAAHSALASVLVREGELERARREAQAALAANIALGDGARLAEPLAALAFTQLFLARDPLAARASAERALGLDALDLGARRALVWTCVVEGRFDDALRELEPARQSGQFDAEIATDEAWIRYFAGDPLAARQLLSAVVRREPLFRRAHAALAALHLAERRLAAAAVELELLDALDSGANMEDERIRRLTSASWAPPDASEAARLLEERAAAAAGLKPATGGTAGAATQAARIYAQFGESAEALSALARALERREAAAILARVDPAFAALRGSAAFRKLLDEAGVPPLAKPAGAR
jgi:DNA-binding winged helix-turn-helix (wHTH) protein